jgi:hypothetical protein
MRNVVLFFLVTISFELSAQRELKTFFDNGTVKSSYKYTDLNNYDVSNFYTSGKLMETGSFVNGKMNGLWTSYSENGVKSGEAFYSNGIKSGEWKIYDEVGSLGGLQVLLQRLLKSKLVFFMDLFGLYFPRKK